MNPAFQGERGEAMTKTRSVPSVITDNSAMQIHRQCCEAMLIYIIIYIIYNYIY